MSVAKDWEKHSSKTTIEEKLVIAIAENVKLQNKVNKLKALLLLVDDSVSHVEMNALTMKQWVEFTNCFPEELE